MLDIALSVSNAMVSARAASHYKVESRSLEKGKWNTYCVRRDVAQLMVHL